VPDPTVDPAAGPPRQLSPVPFVAALVGFVVLAALAFVFLRADDDGRLVRPDRFQTLDEDTIRATALGQPGCGRVERAQVDLSESEILVELVVVDAEGPCSDVAVDLVAEITLPEPVGDRAVRAGVGRSRLPCTDGDAASSARSRAARRADTTSVTSPRPPRSGDQWESSTASDCSSPVS